MSQSGSLSKLDVQNVPHLCQRWKQQLLIALTHILEEFVNTPIPYTGSSIFEVCIFESQLSPIPEELLNDFLKLLFWCFNYEVNFNISRDYFNIYSFSTTWLEPETSTIFSQGQILKIISTFYKFLTCADHTCAGEVIELRYIEFRNINYDTNKLFQLTSYHVNLLFHHYDAPSFTHFICKRDTYIRIFLIHHSYHLSLPCP